MTTVLLLAHPTFADSRANRAMLAGLNNLSGLEVADLYALYPDCRIDASVGPIRVNVVSAGVIDTPWWGRQSHTLKEHVFERAAATLPAGRVGRAVRSRMPSSS